MTRRFARVPETARAFDRTTTRREVSVIPSARNFEARESVSNDGDASRARGRRMSRVDVFLESNDSKYREGDVVRGEVVVCIEREDAPFQHNGIVLTAVGNVQLRAGDSAVGMLESLFITIDPVTVLDVSLVLAPPGRLMVGMHKFAFQFTLQSFPRSTPMYETFHGQNTQVVYALEAEAGRPILRGGSLTTGMCEFLVESKPDEEDAATVDASEVMSFEITEEQQDLGPAPGPLASEGFLIRGSFDKTCWFLEQAITGRLTVERAASPLKSIEIELCRIEGCNTVEGQVLTETTPVQFSQVVDGDCPRGVEIPIHMVIPRLFTCPSVQAPTFSVSFMLRVLCVFEPMNPGNKEPVAVRAIPIQLYRGGDDVKVALGT